MIEIMLVLIAVVTAMIAIIVNRKSLAACVVIASVAAALCFGFLLLYNNTQHFSSYQSLLKATILGSSILIVVLLAVTFVGVKMHYKKNKKEKSSFGDSVQTKSSAVSVTADEGKVTFAPGTRPVPVGIFGRQPIRPQPEKPVVQAAPVNEKVEVPEFIRRPAPVQEQPAFVPAEPERTVVASSVTQAVTAQIQEREPAAPAAKPAASVAQAAATLVRMLEKGMQFEAAGQLLLAEQMYLTYIERCTDDRARANAELMQLACRIKAGNKERAQEQLNTLVAKLRSGEYALDADQKRKLADCKMALMKMQ